MENSSELIGLSIINKVSLVSVSFCSNAGSIRDYSYWISRENSLVLIKLSSINKVSSVPLLISESYSSIFQQFSIRHFAKKYGSFSSGNFTILLKTQDMSPTEVAKQS
jgi:hypothetical protein